jgi:hypothetical protein
MAGTRCWQTMAGERFGVMTRPCKPVTVRQRRRRGRTEPDRLVMAATPTAKALLL